MEKSKKDLIRITIGGKVVPFQYGQPVYIIQTVAQAHREWIPPNYSLGGDADGPFDRGHYQTTFTHTKEVNKVPFSFKLLDDYAVEEIFDNAADARFCLLLKEKGLK